RYATVFFLRTKDEVFEKFKEYLANVPHKPSALTLRSDNGGEYTSTEFKDWAAKNGIKLEPSPPYTPQYNGVAERFNRTINNMTRALLLDASLTNGFWAEAVNFASYVNNRVPSKAINNKSPYE